MCSEDSGKVVCGDYIEFGSNDLVPFVTLERSGRLCSYSPGMTFDEPNGELLIWLHLRSLQTAAETSRLSLVITPYRTEKDKYFNIKCQRWRALSAPSRSPQPLIFAGVITSFVRNISATAASTVLMMGTILRTRLTIPVLPLQLPPAQAPPPRRDLSETEMEYKVIKPCLYRLHCRINYFRFKLGL